MMQDALLPKLSQLDAAEGAYMRRAEWQTSCLICCLLVAVSADKHEGQHQHLGVRVANSHKSTGDKYHEQAGDQEMSSIGNSSVHHKSQIGKVCQGTRGTWCQTYHELKPLPWKAPLHGKKTCLNSCNSVGVCNADTGLCSCPAGPACNLALKRPCTNKWRSSGGVPSDDPGLSEPGMTASRCGGVCDDDLALCYCNGTYGHVRAADGMPAGTPPIQIGRPMVDTYCNPSKDNQGNPAWGLIDPEMLYGPTGWCEAAQPEFKCDCIVDGLSGDLCEQRTEQFCLNSCSGHGECNLGFCRCHKGYYGIDCAQKTVDQASVEEDGAIVDEPTWHSRPWLRDTIHTPAADPPPSPYRRRPLIYVYDAPPEYNTRMLQYRVAKSTCVHRMYGNQNESYWGSTLYGVETAILEMLLQSPHRTFDGDEADFFYVPAFVACWQFPVYGWADAPWWYAPGGPRVMHAANMLLEVKRWIQHNFPYWDRHGGRDHIWLSPHDEGTCIVPAELRPSVILGHWGRMDKGHTSGTAYLNDNYTQEHVTPEWSPHGWTHILKTEDYACHDPEKDLVVPTFKTPSALYGSPLIGGPAQPRDNLLFFRGDFRPEDEVRYSRGIRQTLRRISQRQSWKDKYRILVGNATEVPGDYNEHLRTSKFCLVLPGDGFSSRAEDAVLQGCLPVVIMDNVEPTFANILDWSAFSIRVAEDQLERVPEILQAIPEERVRAMQIALSKVWHRFTYSSMPIYHKELLPHIERNRQAAHENPHHTHASLPAPQHSNLTTDDAFATIIQLLGGRAALGLHHRPVFAKQGL